jgi:DGQHR domain-containing protein
MPSVFQVVRGQQRNQVFFQTIMDYGEIADLVKMPEDVLGDQLFNKDQTMQRKVNWARVRSDLVPYLENDDAFYSALTLVMIPRDFTPLSSDDGYEYREYPGSNGVVGELRLTSAIYLFPADGQHRAASIREALLKHPELALQQVPVVLVPFRNRAAVRQMFSDLNLNAKPPSKTIGLSFETRDPVALIAKEMEKEIPLFKDRVNHMSNSLPASSANVITMNTLYTGTDDLLRALFDGSGSDPIDDLHGKKVGSPELKKATDAVKKAWEAILLGLPVWKNVLAGHLKPADIREDYVLGFGVGWQAIALASASIIRDFDEWEEIVPDVLSKVRWEKANPGWQGVCMIGSRVNNTGPAVRATAGYILECGGFGSEDNPFASALGKSRADYAELEVQGKVGSKAA